VNVLNSLSKIFVASLLVAGVGTYLFAQSPILPPEKPTEFKVESDERAALRLKIGQLIVVGFQGNDASDAGVKNLALQIERGEVGGILHLGHNIPRSGEEIRGLISYFDSHNLAIEQPALLHALDQEGGRIQRLKPWHGVDKVESAEAMVNVSIGEAFNAYKTLACQLSNLGYNWNLGPVVDLDINKRNPVISRLERAFSANPSTVSTYAEQFVQAHHEPQRYRRR